MAKCGVPSLLNPLSAPPENAFLTEFLGALSKRRKPIGYKLRKMSVEKVLEPTGTENREKLEIVCEGWRRQSLRFFLWDDRWLFVDARLPGRQGWTWEFTREGRLTGAIDAPNAVGMLEKSIELSWLGEKKALDLLWTPFLAHGPKLAG